MTVDADDQSRFDLATLGRYAGHENIYYGNMPKLNARARVADHEACQHVHREIASRLAGVVRLAGVRGADAHGANVIEVDAVDVVTPHHVQQEINNDGAEGLVVDVIGPLRRARAGVLWMKIAGTERHGKPGMDLYPHGVRLLDQITERVRLLLEPRGELRIGCQQVGGIPTAAAVIDAGNIDIEARSFDALQNGIGLSGRIGQCMSSSSITRLSSKVPLASRRGLPR